MESNHVPRRAALRTIAAALAAGSGTLHAQHADFPEGLVELLRKGGYVLFLRHPKTHADQADIDPWHLENVAAQRQLTDEGRADARAIGEAWRKLGIPVGRVITSRFHRAKEAGQLLGFGAIESTIDVSEGGLVVPPKENQRRAAALRRLLATSPDAGKNVVIVSHRPNLHEAAGKELSDAGEGEVIVFQPLGGESFKVVTRVGPPTRWSSIAVAHSR